MYLIVKRLLDFFLSLLLIFILSPLFIVVCLILSIQNRGNVFFLQNRSGINEVDFLIIKFKTMSDKLDNNGNLLPDVERITVLGNVIRNYSLDELPQLFNVLKGDMSLIGPRPLLPKYSKLYSDYQRRRFQVKPGITGWAQVNGRNEISWTQKFALDLYYVDNISFKLDVKIFFLTIFKVIGRQGINQSKSRPMQPFNGSN